MIVLLAVLLGITNRVKTVRPVSSLVWLAPQPLLVRPASSALISTATHQLACSLVLPTPSSIQPPKVALFAHLLCILPKFHLLPILHRRTLSFIWNMCVDLSFTILFRYHSNMQSMHRSMQNLFIQILLS